MVKKGKVGAVAGQTQLFNITSLSVSGHEPTVDKGVAIVVQCTRVFDLQESQTPVTPDNRCSAVAEMGDRLAMAEKRGAVPLSGGGAGRIRGFTTMRYINLRFTYLLTYWVATQIVKSCSRRNHVCQVSK